MIDNVLITGASRGLGLWLAKTFLDKGAFVIALNKIKTPEFSRLASDHPGKTAEYMADLTNEKSIMEASESLKELTGNIDIIINNAGVHPEPSAHKWKHIPDLSDISLEKINLSISVNAIGPLLVIRYFLPFLKNGVKKMLINISSEAGSISRCFRKDEFGYGMSKAALNMQSKILQNRLSEFDIKVLAVHPGWMKTDMGGPEALDYPETCAGRIAELAYRKWELDGPIYIDSNGAELGW